MFSIIVICTVITRVMLATNFRY